MPDLHNVETTLCTGCLYDVGNDCHAQHCDTYKARVAMQRRQTVRNMKLTAEHQRWVRQQSIRVGLKR